MCVSFEGRQKEEEPFSKKITLKKPDIYPENCDFYPDTKLPQELNSVFSSTPSCFTSEFKAMTHKFETGQKRSVLNRKKLHYYQFYGGSGPCVNVASLMNH
jgi:hypothetical protein